VTAAPLAPRHRADFERHTQAVGLVMRRAEHLGMVPRTAQVLRARYTAPGRSVCASLNALRTISGIASGFNTMSAHLVTGRNIATRSTP
jgi:hypothetical protein